MPISSIVRLAFTLPSLGRDSRADRTFIFAITGSLSARSRSPGNVREPIFSSSLISARARRASAAFTKAARRCSSVSSGSPVMTGTLASKMLLVKSSE